MVYTIRAVYEQGKLRLLDPVELIEGQQIQIAIRQEQEMVRAALGDLLVQPTSPLQDKLDEEALMRQLDKAFAGQKPLSETIIEERREGP
jgi:predicted DNA-binding antitoxin AbrB/MazE fold protein